MDDAPACVKVWGECEPDISCVGSWECGVGLSEEEVKFEGSNEHVARSEFAGRTDSGRSSASTLALRRAAFAALIIASGSVGGMRESDLDRVVINQ